MSEKPIYVQLMDSIKKKIQDGQLQVGDRLVSEREMSEQYGINRMTVRNAFKKIKEHNIPMYYQITPNVSKDDISKEF